jgi:predicted PurR-regulated permease PerM
VVVYSKRESPAIQESLDNEKRVEQPDQRSLATGPIISIIVATGVFYFGKTVLLPLAMASVLAIVFSPIAGRLERLIGRAASAAIVVIAGVSVITAIGYFLTVEMTAVAVNVADYSSNIAAKITSFEASTPPSFQRIEKGVTNIQKRLAKANPQPPAKRPAVSPPSEGNNSSTEILKQAVPLVTGVGEAALVIVLLFFLLYGRNDLRDRLIRLAARGRITITAQVIETAGATVGRYLLILSVVNLCFGIVVSAMMWILGLPDPEFWGILALLLRFIPYIGAMTSAILPTLVAFAVFPGWSKCLEVFATFVILDQITAQLVEPFFIGRGIGVSPVALLISTMYWSWLWGIPGLLLAAPLTACFKIAGDHVQSLGFLAILLGAD